MKRVEVWEKKGKISLGYISSYEILDKIGDVAHQLALPSAFAKMHNVFHVSMLRKYNEIYKFLIEKRKNFIRRGSL